MMKAWAQLATLTLATFSTSSMAAKPTPPANPMDPLVWEIGPVIGTQNYSVNMPLRPSANPGGGWYFNIPYPNADAGHVHYLTFKHGPLTGKTRIVMRYRLEMADGVRLIPTKLPDTTEEPSKLTLYFQRRNDNWSAAGKYEAYRWWASFATVAPLTRGEHELSVPLDGEWTAVYGTPASANPDGFRAAIRDTDRVGFALGGGDGLGHGVYATGAAKFVVTSFQVVSSTDFGIRSASGTAAE